MTISYTHRIKGPNYSVYVTGFDEVKEQAKVMMDKNHYGHVYEVIGGKHVLSWKFDPFYGNLERA